MKKPRNIEYSWVSNAFDKQKLNISHRRNVKNLVFKIVNWRLMNSQIINIDRRNFVYTVDDSDTRESVIIILWLVIQEDWENLKVQHLWSDLAWEFELDIKTEICDDQNLDFMNTNVTFWWKSGKSFNPYENEQRK